MMTLSQLPRMAGTFAVLALAISMSTSGVAQTKKHHPTIKKAAAKKAAPKQSAPKVAATPVLVGPMVGTWTLREGEKERFDVRIAFRANGTFAFVGSNFKSEGTYQYVEDKLKLVWTSIDGEPCKPGTVHKDYSLGETDGSLTIDRYTYRKH